MGVELALNHLPDRTGDRPSTPYADDVNAALRDIVPNLKKVLQETRPEIVAALSVANADGYGDRETSFWSASSRLHQTQELRTRDLARRRQGGVPRGIRDLEGNEKARLPLKQQFP